MCQQPRRDELHKFVDAVLKFLAFVLERNEFALPWQDAREFEKFSARDSTVVPVYLVTAGIFVLDCDNHTLIGNDFITLSCRLGGGVLTQ
jgi:hypothetical protein